MLKHVFLWSGLCFILLGCSSSIEIAYYSLEHSRKAPSSSGVMDKNIAIERFTSSSAIRRNEVVFRNLDKNHVSFSGEDIWWTLPEDMVSEALVDYFIRQKIFRHTFIYPSTHQVDYVLEGILKEFEIQSKGDQWQIKISLQVYFTGQEDQKIIWDSGILELELPCESNMEDAVAQMSLGLEQLFIEITAQVKKMVS